LFFNKPYFEQNINDIFTLLFTSGSSGIPKAVKISPEIWLSDIKGAQPYLQQPLIGCSYIPLSHSSDRARCWEFLGNFSKMKTVKYQKSQTPSPQSFVVWTLICFEKFPVLNSLKTIFANLNPQTKPTRRS
jgi:acyl-CoA synthetase (AMP-forming)/AMP-acid ligase II